MPIRPVQKKDGSAIRPPVSFHLPLALEFRLRLQRDYKTLQNEGDIERKCARTACDFGTFFGRLGAETRFSRSGQSDIACATAHSRSSHRSEFCQDRFPLATVKADSAFDFSEAGTSFPSIPSLGNTFPGCHREFAIHSLRLSDLVPVIPHHVKNVSTERRIVTLRSRNRTGDAKGSG